MFNSKSLQLASQCESFSIILNAREKPTLKSNRQRSLVSCAAIKSSPTIRAAGALLGSVTALIRCCQEMPILVSRISSPRTIPASEMVLCLNIPDYTRPHKQHKHRSLSSSISKNILTRAILRNNCPQERRQKGGQSDGYQTRISRRVQRHNERTPDDGRANKESSNDALSKCPLLRSLFLTLMITSAEVKIPSLQFLNVL